MPCPAHRRAHGPEAAAILLIVALVLAGCARTADRGGARALPQPTPDRTLDAVVRGLVTITPLEAETPAAQRFWREKKADALVLTGKPWEALPLYEEILQECPDRTSTQQRVRALRE